MRVAIASITYEGVMRNKKEMMQKLLRERNELCIIAPSSRSTDDSKELGIKFYPISIESHGKNPFADYRLYKDYIVLYKQIKPDVVLNLTIKPNVYSGLACRKLHIPYIGTINGVGDAIYNGGFLSKITLRLLKAGEKKAECVFFQNKKNRALFVGNSIVPESKTMLVPGSGINVELHPYEEYPESSSPVVLTFIGRVSKDKGTNELLETARILKEKKADVQINVVGGCVDSYKNLIDQAHREGVVNYLGRVEPTAIHGILKDSHAVLLPSYHEGIANVLLEGGSAGRPIIASFAEGCEETFDDGISGIGFEPKSTDALLKAIERFLKMSNPERRIMGIEAHRKIVAEFNRDIVDAAYINKIRAIIGG